MYWWPLDEHPYEKHCFKPITDHPYEQIVTELRPLIDVNISFSLNIFRKNGQTLTKFCIHIIIDNIYVGIFRKFVTEFRLLVDVRVLFPLNLT